MSIIGSRAVDVTATKRAFRAIAIGLALITAPSSALAWGYFIEESMDYTGYNCTSGDLNEVTAELKAQLDWFGHSGFRKAEVGVYPQHWWESCSSSLLKKSGAGDRHARGAE